MAYYIRSMLNQYKIIMKTLSVIKSHLPKSHLKILLWIGLTWLAIIVLIIHYVTKIG
jgi:hypothetical protein